MFFHKSKSDTNLVTKSVSRLPSFNISRNKSLNNLYMNECILVLCDYFGSNCDKDNERYKKFKVSNTC